MNDKPESVKPRPCSYCGHVYIKICDGREGCPNRVWLEEKKNVTDPSKEDLKAW